MWAALGQLRAHPTPEFYIIPVQTRIVLERYVCRAHRYYWRVGLQLQPTRVRCTQVHVVRVQRDALTVVNVPAAVVQRIHNVRVQRRHELSAHSACDRRGAGQLVFLLGNQHRHKHSGDF